MLHKIYYVRCGGGSRTELVTALCIIDFMRPPGTASDAQPPDIACKNMCQPPSMNPFEGFGVINEVAGMWFSRPGLGYRLALKAA